MPDNQHGGQLFFLHVRKAGGLTVRNWLQHDYALDDILLDWHHRDKNMLSPDGYRFVTGHVGFDAVTRFSRRPRVLVFLRDPLERAISAFFFYRDTSDSLLDYFSRHMPPAHYRQRERFTRRARQLGLRRFLEQEETLARAWLYNVQARVLAGFVDGDPVPMGEAAILQRARQNLASCDFVGLTEKMGESLAWLGQRLGKIRQTAVRHDHRSQTRPPADRIDPESLECLESWNRLDSVLYRDAAKRFAELGATVDPWPEKHGYEAPPPAADYRFDLPVTGNGWHPRERYNDRWICWNGYEPVADLELSINSGGDSQLECRVEKILHPRVLDGLQLRIGETPLDWQMEHRQEHFLLKARVSRHSLPLPGGRIRLVFDTPHTVRPCDIAPGNPDSRRLGVAVSGIRLRPIR